MSSIRTERGAPGGKPVDPGKQVKAGAGKQVKAGPGKQVKAGSGKQARAGSGKQARAGTKDSGKASQAASRLKQRGFGTRGPHEVSAGGVVVHEGKVLVIVPTRRAADGSLVLALPKGHLDDGETAEQAATREVREETGVRAAIVGELGEVRYWYVREKRRVAKSVFFFLFRYVSGDLEDHDDEVLEARWMGFAEAREALSYRGERDMVDRAVALGGQDR